MNTTTVEEDMNTTIEKDIDTTVEEMEEEEFHHNIFLPVTTTPQQKQPSDISSESSTSSPNSSSSSVSNLKGSAKVPNKKGSHIIPVYLIDVSLTYNNPTTAERAPIITPSPTSGGSSNKGSYQMFHESSSDPARQPSPKSSSKRPSPLVV